MNHKTIIVNNKHCQGITVDAWKHGMKQKKMNVKKALEEKCLNLGKLKNNIYSWLV